MSRRVAKTRRQRFSRALRKAGWRSVGQRGKTIIAMERERGEPPFQRIEIIRGSDGRDRIRYYERTNWRDPWEFKEVTTIKRFAVKYNIMWVEPRR